MRPDDIVVIIWGCIWPFVLRPVDNGRHETLGPCYVYGIMEGEATKAHVDSGAEDTVFRLG